jgi:hypothetical protein
MWGPATVDRNAYVFCVLEGFHTRLKRRDIFALVSDRWSDPMARLLTGPAWETAKGPALGALQLPEEPPGAAGRARRRPGRRVAGHRRHPFRHCPSR